MQDEKVVCELKTSYGENSKQQHLIRFFDENLFSEAKKAQNLLRLRFRKTFMNSVGEKTRSYDKEKVQQCC